MAESYAYFKKKLTQRALSNSERSFKKKLTRRALLKSSQLGKLFQEETKPMCA